MSSGSLYHVIGLASAGKLTFKDDAQLRLGDSGDLSLYHDGDNSVIGNSTGELEIVSDNLQLRSNTGDENYFVARVGSAASIYHDNTLRFQTTGIGVTVPGSVGIRTNLEVAGVSTLGSANIVAAGGTFQVGAGGTVLYVDTSGTLTIGSATTLATVSLNGGSIPSIGLVIALGG